MPETAWAPRRTILAYPSGRGSPHALTLGALQEVGDMGTSR
jgi:hypothetical protein